MPSQQLETTDIFKGAVFLCNGGRLAGLRLKEQQRRIISFTIEGEDILQLDMDYRSGDALVNALLFKETLNHLRDIMFARLRDENEGRTRYDDGKSKDRGR